MLSTLFFFRMWQSCDIIENDFRTQERKSYTINHRKFKNFSQAADRHGFCCVSFKCLCTMRLGRRKYVLPFSRIKREQPSSFSCYCLRPVLRPNTWSFLLPMNSLQRLCILFVLPKVREDISSFRRWTRV